MNDRQLKLYKLRWTLIAVGLVAAGLIIGFEKLFH